MMNMHHRDNRDTYKTEHQIFRLVSHDKVGHVLQFTGKRNRKNEELVEETI